LKEDFGFALHSLSIFEDKIIIGGGGSEEYPGVIKLLQFVEREKFIHLGDEFSTKNIVGHIAHHHLEKMVSCSTNNALMLFKYSDNGLEKIHEFISTNDDVLQRVSKFNKEGKILASGSNDGVFKLWRFSDDFKKEEKVMEFSNFENQSDPILDIIWVSDEQVFVLTALNIFRLDIKRNEIDITLKPPTDLHFNGIAYSSIHKALYTIQFAPKKSNSISIWELENNSKVKQIDFNSKEHATCINISPSEKYIAIGTVTGRLKVFDTSLNTITEKKNS